jgi:hypothetical protein
MYIPHIGLIALAIWLFWCFNPPIDKAEEEHELGDYP